MTGGAGGVAGQCSPEELRGLFLFEKLTFEQLAWLCRKGRVEAFEPGPVYTEGEPATCFYVMVEGTVVLSHRVGPDDVEVNRSSSPGVYAGAFQAYLGERVPQVYMNSMRVVSPSRFFVLSAHDFAGMMHDWFPMAEHLLEGLFFGTRTLQQAVGQRERLLALGTLSAGLTHELNNPAAAAVRATAALRERVAQMRGALGKVAGKSGKAAGLDELVRLEEEAVRAAAKQPVLGPLEASDREDALTDWLDDHEVAEGWELAPVLVQAGLDADWLERVDAAIGTEGLAWALRWLTHGVETELLLGEIEAASSRISSLVGAARQYSQLDRAPYQQVDLHELLDSTLVILGGKTGPGITVVKDYDRSLPRVPAFAAELNQVWTNLIDNALYAMAGHGTLTISTRADHDRAVIGFRDTGPGVPADIQGRIFEPFFTSKPVGDGTGLGLDISWRIVVHRHHGDLRVESVPGDTLFEVTLPLTAQDPDQDPDRNVRQDADDVRDANQEEAR
ncbi:ATP-binding protein [Streptacidiphilus carbonis]|uniref:ATP-binding protein n=1 Tax=Streptacidiphilus carbonis TaxID=105422 RepID=UPI0005A726B0|nr:ATP-binding protein [Streptacidiphilus carbonis]